MSFEPRFSITDPIAAALARIERARNFLDTAKLPEAWLTTMRSRALGREAYHTTHLDGGVLTLERTEQILADPTAASATPAAAHEVRNCRDALEFVSECRDGGVDVTEGWIREMHGRLVDGLGGGVPAPGAYRRVDGYVVASATRHVIYRPPPASDVPILVGELVKWMNAEHEAHPIVAAGIVQFQLAYVQPFLDGNGRTSRLLSMLSLFRAGYDFKGLLVVSEHYDRNRTAFRRAEQKAREAGMDLTGWLEFFTEGLAAQLDAVKSQCEREIQRDAITRHGLTERQVAAVRHVLREGRLTPRDFGALCPGMARRTLQRELKQLVDKGLLRRMGPANRPQYRAGDELG